MSGTPSVAIVGSGPSGCFLAQTLRKRWPESEITVFDQLASPFGLIRYGVAPDHQNTKSVARQFERLFEREQVRFAGNVRIGRDITLNELQEAFTVVAFATGLSKDRTLGVEGDTLPGVVGAGVITRKLNSHPDSHGALTPFGERIALVGAGNVAMDILRFLLKRPSDFDDSDVNDAFVLEYDQARARRIDVIGRSPARDSKCDAIMLRELGKIDGIRFQADAIETAPEEAETSTVARINALTELCTLNRKGAVDTEVHFHFGWTPTRVIGDQRVSGIEFVGTEDTSQTLLIQADSVISAIGFELDANFLDVFIGRTIDLTPNPESGRIGAGLYRTGWFKRGSRGAIAANRSDAKAVADEIFADFEAGKLVLTPSHRGFDSVPESVKRRAISFFDWQRLDDHERTRAAERRVRYKIPDHEEMVTLARG